MATNVLTNDFIPLITVLVVSALTLMVTGPPFKVLHGCSLHQLVSSCIWLDWWIYYWWFLPSIGIIFGLHWGVVPLVAQQIAGTGESIERNYLFINDCSRCCISGSY